jgi:GNAT superfamily N-acetyltransferase
MSERSRYRRFFSPVKELSTDQLRHLTEVDWVDHVAWVAGLAAVPRHPGRGVARYVRLKGEPEVAEAAIAVIDDFQNRGLGHVLLHRLAHSAIAGGVRRLRAYVLADNKAMLALLQELGVTQSSFEDGLVRVDVELPATESELDASTARKLLRLAAAGELDFRSPLAGPLVSARGVEPPRPLRGTRS